MDLTKMFYRRGQLMIRVFLFLFFTLSTGFEGLSQKGSYYTCLIYFMYMQEKKKVLQQSYFGAELEEC